MYAGLTPVKARSRVFILLLVAAAWAIAAPVLGEATALGEPSRFQRTALALRDSPAEQRSLFAQEALGELYAIYAAEADLARSEAASTRNSSKLRTWSAAVDRFASQLLVVLQAVEQGAPVAITVRRNNVLVIDVAERFVMLTHPRQLQQHAYEQHVLSAFCSRSDCLGLTAQGTDLYELPAYAGDIAPVWSFSSAGPVCSHESVAVQFSNSAELPRIREICRQFLGELNDLLTEVSWQQLHGASIDWTQLSIRPTPGHTEYFVELNKAGDTVLLDLPLMYLIPGLIQQVSPWLAERSSQDEAVALVLDGSGWAGYYRER